MALDEALFRSILAGEERCLVRFYRWDRPNLSIGFAQSFGRAVGDTLAGRSGIPVVRRITGGKAVLHDREFTYAVAMPYALVRGENKSLRACYGVVAKSLTAALQRIGIAATRAGRRQDRPPSEICFRSSAEDEILVAGRKLVGSAQRRGRLGFLQHGSILLETGANSSPKTSDGPASRRDAVGLAEILKKTPSLGRIGRLFSQELALHLGLEAASGELPVGMARRLLAKHRSQEWVRRVP